MKPNTKLEQILIDLPAELKQHYIDVLNGKTQEEVVIPDLYTMIEMEEVMKGDTKPFLYSTGWSGLDKLAAGGMAAGEVILCAAQAGMGKTHFAVNLAANLAKRNHPVFYLTMEDGYKMIVDRFKSMGFPEEVRKNILLMKEDELNLKNALPLLKKAVDDSSMIIVDNLFSLPLRQGAKTDYWTGQAEWVDDLCNMIRSTDSTCMILHHLNKTRENTVERWQIAGSTRLVNRVGQVWLLHRSETDPLQIAIKSEKNRRSPFKGECFLKSGRNGELFGLEESQANPNLKEFVSDTFTIAV